MFVLAAGVAWGQPAASNTVVDANIPPATKWTYHLPFNEAAEGVRSAVFAPDRPSIYVHLNLDVFDTWRALVWYWPEVLGAALGTATIIALLIAWRVGRRRQRAGAPHCRRCNYDLSPQIGRDDRGGFRPPADAGARCPECGVIIARARPVRGRRTWVRLLPLGVAWILMVGAYAGMWMAGLPREGRASVWLDWSSAQLASWITAQKLGGLKQFINPGDQVVEVDLRTGKVAGVVTTRRSRTWSEISVTPDGSGLILAGDTYGTLQLISTRTGRRLSRVRFSELDRPNGIRWRTLIGYSPDGRIAYVPWTQQEMSGVSGWNLITNDVRTLVQNTESEVAATRAYVLRPGSQESIISFPIDPDSIEQDGFALRSEGINESAGAASGFSVTPIPAFTQDPQVTSDGAAMFLLSKYGESILRVELDEPHSIMELSAGARSAYGFGWRLDLSHDNRYLLASLRTSLLVRDLTRQRWSAALALPGGAYGPFSEISTDNRWVAAVVQTGNGQRTPIRHELVVWDLGQILSSTYSGGDEPPPASDSSER